MPRIIINEDELTTFAQFNATENSVLIPLFVTNDKEPKRYTSLSSFKKDFPIGTIKNDKDSEGNYPINIEGGVVSYWIETKTFTEPDSSEEKYREIAWFDKSYLMICELLSAGLVVVVAPITHEPFEKESDIIEEIQNVNFSSFGDKNLWNIKFITTGAYPNVLWTDSPEQGQEPGATGAYAGIRKVASSRGDCISLMEFPEETPFDKDASSQSSESKKSLKDYIESIQAGAKCEAAFYPWGTYNTAAAGLSNQTVSSMPACFGYLLAVAINSLNNNADWLANSGVIRGKVPGLSSLKYNIGESAMHYLQCDIVSEDDTDGDANTNMAVNPIMPVGTYGIRIWGNRTTASDGITDNYSNFLNVRILLCDIKKQLYHSSLRITFEPNDDIAWINFKKLNNTLLDQMQSGRGIQWYRWKKLVAGKKATLKALLTVKPIEALEYFDITVSLAEDETVEVEEL